MPEPIAGNWASLRKLLSGPGDWDVWLDWAEARFRGGPDWPKPVYDELTTWRKEWDRDPALVNADIKALMTKHAVILPPEQSDGVQFGMTPEGLSVSDPGNANSGEDRLIQSTLYDELRELAPDFTQRCHKTQNTHRELALASRAYAAALEAPFDRRNAAKLFALGARLVQMNQELGVSKPGTITPPLEPEHKADLATLATNHSAFILGDPVGRALFERAERMKANAAAVGAIRQPVNTLLKGMVDARAWVESSTRELLGALSTATDDAAWEFAAVGFSQYSAVRNALITVSRWLLYVNEKGGTVAGAVALNYYGIDVRPAIEFLLANGHHVMAIANHSSELRPWFERTLKQLEAGNPHPADGHPLPKPGEGKE
jgi:hypothetical protein